MRLAIARPRCDAEVSVTLHCQGRTGMSWENRVRLTIGVLILCLGWTPAQAQQTVTPIPPPPGLPSIIPQTQAFTSCVLNCDTTVGLCQGACSVNNSPVLTSAAGAHEALTQCYLHCTSQQLACKQACPAPH
jgi:hypothetical protein